MEGSPTGTVPSRWWTAHRIREGTFCVFGECSEREIKSFASRTISAMVLIASFEYAWYSRRVTIFPKDKMMGDGPILAMTSMYP